MSESLAKLKTIRERTKALMELYNSPAKDMFDSLRDQFFKESEKLKIEFPAINDFVPENYDKWIITGNSYHKAATRALRDDIDYFINYISNIQDVQLPNLKITNEGLFFAGQYFDALSKLIDIIKTSKSEIIFIDGYIDEKVLNVFSVLDGTVKIKILTKVKSITASFNTLISEFNKQYRNCLEVKSSESFHDRFLIIDRLECYHIGASMKDAGNKGFMFSRIEEPFLQKKLNDEFNNEWK